MALSNTATPKYYGIFREKVLRGEIPVCKEISMEMNRIDALIADPKYYYDDSAIDGFIEFVESEMTLTDGSDVFVMDSFKLWAEQLLSWYIFVDRSVYVPRSEACEKASDAQTVYHRGSGRCQVDVRFVSASVFPHGRHHNHSPDYCGPHDAVGNRNHPTDQDGNDPF